MKILIAIISCARDVANGVNQAIRETWIPNLRKYGYEYRFFVGVGPTPKEEDLHPGFLADADYYRKIKYPGCDEKALLREDLLKGDEILVPCDDSWLFLPYKVMESRRWAMEQGYDFVFKIDVDTYLYADRLSQGQFLTYDYWGGVRTEHNNFIYAGGSGYMLSKKAYSLTVDAPITVIGEDYWTGLALREHDIRAKGWKTCPVEPELADHGKIGPEHILGYHFQLLNKNRVDRPKLVRAGGKLIPVVHDRILPKRFKFGKRGKK